MSTSSPSNTDIDIEYGVRKPNGEEEWNGQVQTLSRGAASIQNRSIEQVHKVGTTRTDWVRYLTSIADEAGINRAEYVNGHRLIERQRIIVTLPSIEADPTVQPGYTEEVPF